MITDQKFNLVDGINKILGKAKIDSILISFYRSSKPDYCFIGILEEEEKSHIQTLVLLEKGNKITNIIYPLAGSPNEKILKKKTHVYKKFAKRCFPEDIYIQRWGVRAYVSNPILDDEKNVIGFLVACYCDPIHETQDIIGQMILRREEIALELERKRRDSILGIRGKRFEALIRNSRDIFIITNRIGNVIYRAPSNDLVMGIPGEKSIGLNIFELIHPHDVPVVQKTFRAVVRKPGRTANIQARVRDISGEYKCIEGTLTNQLKEPTIHGIVVNYHDVSETRRISEEIAHNERRFRALIERSHDCISMLNADNERLYYSPSVTRILGYKPEELLGTDAHSLTHPDEIEEMRRIGDELRQAPNNSITYQARLRAKDGSWKRIEAIATNMLDDPDVGALVVNFRDISDRKSTEDQLKESERRFRVFLETVNLAALVLDPDGRIEFINDYLLKLTGRSRYDVIGSSFFEKFLEPDDKFVEVFRAGIKNDQIPLHFEMTIITNFRDERLINWNSTVLRNIEGAITGIACIGDDITDDRRNKERARLQMQRVSALHAIDVVISSSFDSRIVFSVIVDQIFNQMGVDAVRILAYDPTDHTLMHVADRGFNYSDRVIGSINLGDSHSGRVILERHTMRFPEPDNNSTPLPEIFNQEGFVIGYSTPMIVKGAVKGVIEVYNRSHLDPDSSWIEFFETLAGQAAISIENGEMFDRLERALADLTSAYDSTLEGWVRALDLRDKETIGHTQRVAMIVVRFALELGVSGDELVNIRRGALLHDIGKMGIPDYILNKAGPLTESERQIIERHPQYAYELLQPIAYLKPALAIPYSHHERWDGTGYPLGLKGEQIPLAARIFSVVDVWDALGSTRTYREKWNSQEMLDYLEQQSGKKFDPSIVKTFIDLYKRNLI